MTINLGEEKKKQKIEGRRELAAAREKFRKTIEEICEKEGLTGRETLSASEYLMALEVLVRIFNRGCKHPLFVALESDFLKMLENEDPEKYQRLQIKYQRIKRNAEYLETKEYEGETVRHKFFFAGSQEPNSKGYKLPEAV